MGWVNQMTKIEQLESKIEFLAEENRILKRKLLFLLTGTDNPFGLDRRIDPVVQLNAKRLAEESKNKQEV